MDRIRMALDLARLERSRTVVPLRTGPMEPAPQSSGAPITEGVEAPAAKGPEAPAQKAPGPQASVHPAIARGANLSAAEITYTLTRVFSPPADILERNRILNPGSAEPAAVAYRMLRTQVLQRMNANGWRTLGIFSPNAKDGKTTTAVNLAASLANHRLHTVLLVEFDFKHPTLAARLGLAPEFGSDDAIAGQTDVKNCLYHPDGFERLTLLPARARLNNSSEMLAGPRSRHIVQELRSRYPDRIVLFDLPPVLTADDALAFAPLIECGLVVAAEGRTRRDDLVRTIELLNKTPLVGTVLNRAADAPAR